MPSSNTTTAVKSTPAKGASAFYFGGGVLILASIAIFFVSTVHGIGILPDSVAYMRIGSAHHFAPLYTWILQSLAVFGIDIVDAAWWIGLALLIANIFLIILILNASLVGPVLVLFATSLVIYHPVFVEYHSVAMTEPLFFTLIFVAILAFGASVKRDARSGFILVGALVGLGMLARFSAAPLFPALAITRLCVGDHDMRTKMLDCGLMAAACVMVFGAWLAVSELTSGESTGRAFELAGNTNSAFWTTTLRSLSVMLLPAPAGSAVRGLFLALTGGAVIWAMAYYLWQWLRLPSRRRAEPAMLFPVVLILMSVFYAMFLLVSVTVQYRLNLTGRFLLPLYVFVTLATACVAGSLGFNFARSRSIAAILSAIAAVILASNIARSTIFTRSAHDTGLGYASQSWEQSPVLRAARDLSKDIAIYSNAPDLIALRLGRDTIYLPSRFNHLTGRDDGAETFEQELSEMRERLEKGNARVVIVDDVDWRDYLIGEKELLLAIPLARTGDLADGRIYEARIK